MRSGFDDHANFRWRARPCRIRDTRANWHRDDGSTKLKHQSAVEIESENLAVRFTPFWPKLRLPMSIGKIQEIGGLRTSAAPRRSCARQALRVDRPSLAFRLGPGLEGNNPRKMD